jgi:hypothetical protein
VQKHGVYKITYDQLKKMGFDVGGLDPKNIKIYGLNGGMLPQENSVARPADLVELSIAVHGEDDGVFNKEDYIVFYGEGSGKIGFDVEREMFNYQTNLYSDKNFYFLTVGNTIGKRVGSSEDLSEAPTTIQTFNDFVYYEKDEYNHLKSGREWYQQIADNATFNFDGPGIVENSEMKFYSDAVAQSVKGSSFSIFFNNNLILDQVIPVVPNTTYGVKARHKRDTVVLNTTSVQADSRVKQEIKYQYTSSSTSDKGFLDYFVLSYKRKLSLYDNQTIFRSAESIKASVARYDISNVPDNCEVWDVTESYNPTRQKFSLQSSTASFATSSETLKTFAVFNSKIESPELIGEVANQNLHGAGTPHVLVITHPDFLEEANRLAAHRAAHNSLTTLVTTTDEIYNEFSSGRQDITAIRDFIKHLYDRDQSLLKAVVLFGKGSYDYRDRLNNNTNFVPTYESRNSLSPLETYSSDDFFGFMETEEGEWRESSPSQNHTLDIGIGRLPVKTIDEAKAVVDKIIQYDISKKAVGAWRKNIVFVADDGSNSDGFTSIHQSQANSMAEEIEALHPEFNTRKIFLGTYAKQVAGSQETIPKANDDIIRTFNTGALIINYTGHGNELQWADENIFNDKDIAKLENKLYPFLITATCEFGRNDDPMDISSAERIVIQKNGGAVGMVTTARPVNSNTNFSLNQAFYDALFERESGRYLMLGEVFARTKNNSTSGVANRNFSLLADPSQTLALPAFSVVPTYIKTASGSDTLKALSTVTIKGHVEDGEGNQVTTFTGELEATLFDKQTEFVTTGKNNPAFTFKQWFNPLFRGKASVKEGQFEFDFILPKNISYQVDYGKLSLYAKDATSFVDASGSSTSFKIGESEADIVNDITSPTMKLFMGDTTFVNGGIVNPNSTLIARIEDSSGINISNYGIGNTMVGILDDDKAVYNLSDFFVADTDNYKKGWVHFPIANMEIGKHTLTVKAWDTFNNPVQASVNFIVTDGNNLIIERFVNYPNPVVDETTLVFTHNRVGDDLEIELMLENSAGQQLKAYNFTVEQSQYQVNLLTFNTLTDLDKKLPGGLYFARLVVRSLSNGSKNERVTKLIIVN